MDRNLLQQIPTGQQPTFRLKEYQTNIDMQLAKLYYLSKVEGSMERIFGLSLLMLVGVIVVTLASLLGSIWHDFSSSIRQQVTDLLGVDGFLAAWLSSSYGSRATKIWTLRVFGLILVLLGIIGLIFW